MTPPLLEIVGPAGAGKTTLAAMLCRQSDRIQPISSLKRSRYTPFYVGSAAAVAPVVAHSVWNGNWSGWQDTYWMVRLAASDSILSRELRRRSVIGLLDQGPIYTLARLMASPGIRRDKQLRLWWNRMLSYWAHRLHYVVWLDATADVLAGRVNARAKDHAFKGQPAEVALCLLEEHRQLYSETIELLSGYDALRILRYNTAQDSLETIAAGLAQLLNPGTKGNAKI
jgi:hypothetical protein